jgi:23S rRNA (uracil1939-C5)-methyltransferase
MTNDTVRTISQGAVVEVMISDLTDGGDGVGRTENGVVFVPDTVPGDRVSVRLVRVKRQYAHGKLLEILEPSSQRQRPSCIVADKCGGCQWQHIEYPAQLEAKRNLVVQALTRIGGFTDPHVLPVLTTSNPLGYRNRATYPLGISATGQVQAGYYQKGSHKLVNLNRCPVQDDRLNPLLAEVKQDIQERCWAIYEEELHHGELRHLALQIGRRTGEMLLTLVARRGKKLPGLEAQAEAWLQRYPLLVGVCLNLNGEQTNRIFGTQTRCIAGRNYLIEEFAGLQFQLRSDTFFQVNTDAAEALWEAIVTELDLSGDEVVLDAYCGVGTFTLPLAQRVKRVIGLEVQPEAVAQAIQNATLNNLTNVTFCATKVEDILSAEGSEVDIRDRLDLVLLDPPRSGCDRAVLEALRQRQPQRIVYISCKPATLARDLKILCENGDYQLQRVQPVDFFPQTAHVECVAFLQRG